MKTHSILVFFVKCYFIFSPNEFPGRVSKFAVENVFNSNATIVVLNSTKTTAINDNEIKKKFSKFQNFITSLDAEPLSFIMKAKNFWSFGLFLGPKAKKGQKNFFCQMTELSNTARNQIKKFHLANFLLFVFSEK